jgi:hypothetical protein
MMKRTFMNPNFSAALAGLALMLPVFSHAQDGPPITPYRPSVSSPAQLPAAGQLELELGGLSSKSDDGRRNSLPYTFKLGFNEQWGVVLSGEGYVSAPDDGGQRVHGFGDTVFVLKRAFIVDDATASDWSWAPRRRQRRTASAAAAPTTASTASTARTSAACTWTPT